MANRKKMQSVTSDNHKKEKKSIFKIKETEPKKAEEPVYEVPEELSKDAPFRKSKYIVDDEEDE